MSICKIGETKVLHGKRYRKEKQNELQGGCSGCAFISDDGCALFALGMKNHRISIEDGGRECDDTIWILAEDQPEAPTATPPRDELREQRRFEAAKAAMQGLLATTDSVDTTPDGTALWSVRYADALIAELDRTGEGK